MKYVSYQYYKALYGDKAMSESDFNRFAFDAEREIDKATSGIDNVKKLVVAFPTNEEDAEIVKRCVCALAEILLEINNAEGLVQSADGSVHGKMVASVSAGNESISYSTLETYAGTAVKSIKDKGKVIYDFIANHLNGVADANGVNLLFVGYYPYKV